jgi:hypothetical protein
MSDSNENDTQEPQELPDQQSASDTSNWDDRVSTDPSGEKYIRTDGDETTE